MTRDDGREATLRGRVLARRAAAGVALGLCAGVPQVLAAQVVGALTGSRDRADIGPRFVRRVGEQAGQQPSRAARWSLAALFHFGYAAGWGAAYALAVEAPGARRLPPPLTGGVLGALIYAVAFSRLGAATRTDTERHPDRRPGREWAIQLTSAFSFALILAFGYRRLGTRA